MCAQLCVYGQVYVCAMMCAHGGACTGYVYAGVCLCWCVCICVRMGKRLFVYSLGPCCVTMTYQVVCFTHSHTQPTTASVEHHGVQPTGCIYNRSLLVASRVKDFPRRQINSIAPFSYRGNTFHTVTCHIL